MDNRLHGTGQFMAWIVRRFIFSLVVISISASLSAQGFAKDTTPETNAYLDVYFKHKETFVDDIRIDEINIKNRKNVRAVAVRPIGEIPLHTAILLDISGSQVARAKEIRWLYEQMIHALPLRSVDTARVIYFDEGIRALLNATSSRDLLLKGWDNIRFSGGTAVYDAIYHACRTLTDYPESRKSMFIISDGEDRDSLKSIEDVYREAIGNNIRVYLFVIWKPPVFEGLRPRIEGYKKHKKHIEKTGGKVFLTSDFESGREQLEQIIEEWSHLKRVDLCVDTSGKSASGLKLSVSRKGVKAFYPSVPQTVSNESCYNDPER